MARSAGALSRAVARMIARQATIVAIERLAGDLVAITLEASGFRGVAWTPGDKVQIAMGSVFETRTYTPIEWDAKRGRTRIIGYLHGAGPGCTWLRQAAEGDTCDVLGPRHSLDVRKPVGRIAFIGDETSLGLVYAGARQQDCSYLLEADNADAIMQIAKGWSLGDGIVTAREPGDYHLGGWMVELSALADQGATFVLTGKAQTIQRLKAGLNEFGVPSSRIMTKAYWAPGKTGLD